MAKIVNYHEPFRSGKSSPEDVLKNLRPTHLKYPFLGNETLEDRIAQDAALMAERGVTSFQISAAIERLFEDAPPKVQPFRHKELVCYHRPFVYCPECPWDDFDSNPPGDIRVRTTEILTVVPGKEAVFSAFLDEHDWRLHTDHLKTLSDDGVIRAFSALHPHLVSEHGFLQSPGSPYRVDMEFVAAHLF